MDGGRASSRVAWMKRVGIEMMGVVRLVKRNLLGWVSYLLVNDGGFLWKGLRDGGGREDVCCIP